MSIAVGFNCEDGLVLVADRQFTANHYTYQECKLRELQWANGLAIWAFSGAPDTARRFEEQMLVRFSPSSFVTRNQIERFFKAALENTNLKEGEYFGVLFAAWTEAEEQILLSAVGLDVEPVRLCEIIGWGNSPLARYLRGLYLKAGKSLTVWQSSVFGIYCVLQGKNYDGQYIGGPTDVFVIDRNRKLRKIPEASTRVWESALEAMDQSVVDTFSTVTGRDSPHTRAVDIGKFLTKIEVLGNQIRALKAYEDI